MLYQTELITLIVTNLIIKVDNNTIISNKIHVYLVIQNYVFDIFILARYKPMNVTKINNICIKFKISLKIIAAKTVAVNGCINKPIEPSDEEIFPIPYVIRNCPPNWHKKASKNIFVQSSLFIGMKGAFSKSIMGIENTQQKSVV